MVSFPLVSGKPSVDSRRRSIFSAAILARKEFTNSFWWHIYCGTAGISSLSSFGAIFLKHPLLVLHLSGHRSQQIRSWDLTLTSRRSVLQRLGCMLNSNKVGGEGVGFMSKIVALVGGLVELTFHAWIVFFFHDLGPTTNNGNAQDHGVVCGPGGYVDYLLLPGCVSGCDELGIWRIWILDDIGGNSSNYCFFLDHSAPM